MNEENIEIKEESINQEQPKNNKKKLLVILLIIIVIGGLGFLGWKLIPNNKTNNQEVKEPVKEEEQEEQEEKILKESDVKRVTPTYTEGKEFDDAVALLSKALNIEIKKYNGLYASYATFIDDNLDGINDNKVLVAASISKKEYNDILLSSTSEEYQNYFNSIFQDIDDEKFYFNVGENNELEGILNYKISYTDFINNYYSLFGTKDVTLDKTDYGYTFWKHYGYDKKTNMFYALSCHCGGGGGYTYIIITNIEKVDNEIVISYNIGSIYPGSDDIVSVYVNEYEDNKDSEIIQNFDTEDLSLIYNEEVKDKMVIHKVYFKEINGQYYIDRKE